MKKFIRLDMKGHWKGTEHKSSLAGVEEHGVWEEGISCYDLTDTAYAIENLREYWIDLASATMSDFKEMQVTIFEGSLIGEGSDSEDIAECTSTILETEAAPFMEKIMDLKEEMEDDEITEEEYQESLVNLYKELMQNA